MVVIYLDEGRTQKSRGSAVLLSCGVEKDQWSRRPFLHSYLKPGTEDLLALCVQLSSLRLWPTGRSCPMARRRLIPKSSRCGSADELEPSLELHYSDALPWGCTTHSLLLLLLFVTGKAASACCLSRICNWTALSLGSRECSPSFLPPPV
jgi:hypothetical protein